MSENPDSFTAEDGMIHVKGPREHLFCVGPVMNYNFKNFEVKTKVKTDPGANSGIFLYGFPGKGPEKGYRVQVNSCIVFGERQKSLYSFDDVGEVM